VSGVCKPTATAVQVSVEIMPIPGDGRPRKWHRDQDDPTSWEIVPSEIADAHHSAVSIGLAKLARDPEATLALAKGRDVACHCRIAGVGLVSLIVAMPVISTIRQEALDKAAEQ
jgi:hypothetical protein